ncbi:isoprenylcysteine carboxyl methyltransferase family protein [Psychromarinibacter sediminicola]|uniref:isoprenylcysteine carboxyl methyltransferase family protein n=1 Tax=Psychromarinibacter sediminicola TaxID=3033385 RepID=UPI0023BAC400|nr:isoprenylcysteine carboxyl methyltransferase family protein [Psychromarinibacter sediminicola]
MERLAEMIVARRNAAWSRMQGGREFGAGHYPWMVALHTGFLVACVAEVWLLQRAFLPWLGFPMLAVAIAAQVLRWWCIVSLGRMWNTRVIVIPGHQRLRRGPYRFLNHPNYVAVVAEGVALPLIHSAYLSAVTFSILNAALLRVRIGYEVEALALLRHDDSLG